MTPRESPGGEQIAFALVILCPILVVLLAVAASQCGAWLFPMAGVGP